MLDMWSLPILWEPAVVHALVLITVVGPLPGLDTADSFIHQQDTTT